MGNPINKIQDKFVGISDYAELPTILYLLNGSE